MNDKGEDNDNDKHHVAYSWVHVKLLDVDENKPATFQNGSSYSGQLRNGLMDGEGVLQLASGDVYRSVKSAKRFECWCSTSS